MLGSEKKCIRKGPVETEGRETFTDWGHDLVTLVRCEAGSRKGVCQFAEKHRVEAKPGRVSVTVTVTVFMHHCHCHCHHDDCDDDDDHACRA
jgi:hypothetical protein